MEATFAHQVSG